MKQFIPFWEERTESSVGISTGSNWENKGDEADDVTCLKKPPPSGVFGDLGGFFPIADIDSEMGSLRVSVGDMGSDREAVVSVESTEEKEVPLEVASTSSSRMTLAGRAGAEYCEGGSSVFMGLAGCVGDAGCGGEAGGLAVLSLTDFLSSRLSMVLALRARATENFFEAYLAMTERCILRF